jgi:hypothetical protein
MIKDTTTDDMVNMMLRQMGATSIKTKPAHINIVKFDLSPELRVSYMYEIKKDEGIYLQRVDPYPMLIGKLYNEQDVINIINNDLNKFKSAYGSTNFAKFIEVANNVAAFEKEIENLFMMRNVDAEDLQKIHEEMGKVHDLIQSIYAESKPLD